MSTRGSSSTKLESNSLGFTNALASAFLEWLLMLFIFVDAIFSYLVTRFARYWDLRTPCLLCSRLDRILGNEKLGFYWELICRSHKLEISSLVLCHGHDKLVDVHGMCESCLFSFATVNRSNAETYRLLVGKLGEEPHNYASSSRGRCSCCNEPCTSKAYIQEWLPTKSDGCEATDFDLPILSSTARSVSDKWKDISSPPARTFMLHNQRLDPLSHVGYAELKVTSDTEPEALLSENDDESSLVSENGDAKDVFLNKCVNSEPSVITSADDFISKKLIDPKPLDQKLSLLDLEVPTVLIEPSGGTSVAPIMADNHGLEELSWQQAEPKTDPPLETEHILFAPPLSNPLKTTIKVSPENIPAVLIEDNDGTSVAPTIVNDHGSKEHSWQQIEIKADPSLATELILSASLSSNSPENTTEVLIENVPAVLIEADDEKFVAPTISNDRGVKELSLQQTELKAGPPLETELISRAPPLSNPPETTTEVLIENIPAALIEADDGTSVAPTVANDCSVEELSRQQTELKTDLPLETELISSAPPLSSPPETTTEVLIENMPNHTDSGEMATVSAAQVSGSLDLGDAYKLAVGNKGRQLLSRQWSQKDSARVNEDINIFLPQISPRMAGEMRFSEIFQKRISLERNMSNLSMDGSTVSEIEGESLVDRLKRQVDHDRKSLGALYKELEEERNASAIAASESMSMITRLQEEKAALHMEALQYLRMMEEQSEYDMEALQKANDLLADKEKEMQDLEYELLLYREKFPSEYIIENAVDSVHDMRVENVEESNTKSPYNSVIEKPYSQDKTEESEMSVGVADKNSVKNPLLEFEDERLYIAQCLKKLKEKLTLVSNGGLRMDLPGKYSGNEGNEVSTLNKHNHKKDFEESALEEENSGSPPSIQDQVDFSFQNFGNENGEPCTDTGLVALGNEVSDLNHRLEALEVDRKFIEKTINSLRNGDEGLQFLQEIVHHLRELRKTDLSGCSPMVV